tara:strand:+ start:789 stop:983 length:195 start_codon:yes stop_codon:yes gene_type:complete
LILKNFFSSETGSFYTLDMPRTMRVGFGVDFIEIEVLECAFFKELKKNAAFHPVVAKILCSLGF